VKTHLQYQPLSLITRSLVPTLVRPLSLYPQPLGYLALVYWVWSVLQDVRKHNQIQGYHPIPDIV